MPSRKAAFLGLFALLVYWQYTRYKGSATFGPLLAPGALPPPGDPTAGQSLTGLTPEQETAAICKHAPNLAFCRTSVAMVPIAPAPSVPGAQPIYAPVGTGRPPLLFY
jgi:hypothetical protein